MKTISFTINNDEIELISKRIHELQTLIEKDIPLSDEQMEEYKSLFHLKDLLYRANQIDNQDNFIVIKGMRIERNKVNEFKKLLKIVNVPGLVTMPNYLGDILPGTKYKMPRVKGDNETFEEYENYLDNYYKKLGYKFENITYHPGTKVPRLRNPYPHEMFYPSENGYVLDEDYLGTHNEYYQKYKRYLEEQLALEYQEVIEYAIENFTFLPPIGKDIHIRHKVTGIETSIIIINYNKGKNKKKKKEHIPEDTPLIQALKKAADKIKKENKSMFENRPLETLTPTLKVDITIPDELKKAISNVSALNRKRVTQAVISAPELTARAKVMLPKYLAEATQGNFEVVEVQDGKHLYNKVPKDILFGNALSGKKVEDISLFYELTSRFRRSMSRDSALSRYHNMLLKHFLETNKEITTNEEAIKETAITAYSMRI